MQMRCEQCPDLTCRENQQHRLSRKSFTWSWNETIQHSCHKFHSITNSGPRWPWGVVQMACRQCADDVSWCGQHTRMRRWHMHAQMTRRWCADDMQTMRGWCADDVRTTCTWCQVQYCMKFGNSGKLCIKPKMASLLHLMSTHCQLCMIKKTRFTPISMKSIQTWGPINLNELNVTIFMEISNSFSTLKTSSSEKLLD